MSERPRVYLIDGHYQIFRAYHGLPDLRAPDGSPAGAVRGYAQTLIRFLRRLAPTHVAVAFDAQLVSFRNQIYPDYKRGRTEAPPDLEPQFALCAEVTRALGLPLYAQRGYEADDVIATLVRQLDGADVEVRIVTRDKDLGALVSERVCLYDLARDETSGPREVEAKLGVPPAQVPDLLALMGDAVDNVPGVAGIGRSTARALLRHFGSLDEIPSRGAEWSEVPLRGAARVAERLREGRERLELSRELVRLRDDVPIRASLEELRYRGALREQAEPLFERLGMASMLQRVPRWGA